MKDATLAANAASGQLPTREELTALYAVANRFEGMMVNLSIDLFSALMRDQTARGIVGNVIEFGVYRGKSASVLALNAPRESEVHLIDIADYPEAEKLQPLHPKLSIIKARSEEYIGTPEGDQFQDIRFSHHDASHYFRNVEAEVGFIFNKVRDDGIIVLDDFGFHYAQVMAAYFYLRYQKKMPFEIFLVAGNKAYLCHEDNFEYYENFLISSLVNWMEETGVRYSLVRTDNDVRYRGFHLAAMAKPDAPRLYGVNTWGMTFYTPGKAPYTPGK